MPNIGCLRVFVCCLFLFAAAGMLTAVGCDISASPSGGLPSGSSGGLPTPTPGPAGPQTPTPSPSPSPDDRDDMSGGTSDDATEDDDPSTSPPSTLSCASPADCDNGLYCDGVEECVNTHCQDGEQPCELLFQTCDEETDSCVLADDGCQSDVDCNIGERCDVNSGNCNPELAVNCGPGAGVCNIGNFTPGCENQDCCDDVCTLFPSCCTTVWTDECGGYALSFSDCLTNP